MHSSVHNIQLKQILVGRYITCWVRFYKHTHIHVSLLLIPFKPHAELKDYEGVNIWARLYTAVDWQKSSSTYM